MAKENRKQRFTDGFIRDLRPRADGKDRFVYDSEQSHLGVRVTRSGTRSFIMDFRTDGQNFRITIGRADRMKVKAARAEVMKKLIEKDSGINPAREKARALEAAKLAEEAAKVESIKARTISDLEALFMKAKEPNAAKATMTAFRSLWRCYVVPEWGDEPEHHPGWKNRRVADITTWEVFQLYQQVQKRAPYAANRVLSLLSSAFKLAVKAGWTTSNPVKGAVDKADRFEEATDRGQGLEALPYLEEVGAVLKAEASLDPKPKIYQQRITAARAFEFCMLTGCRLGEARGIMREEVDLDSKIWTIPEEKGKTGKRQVFLPDRAIDILKSCGPGDGLFFPGMKGGAMKDFNPLWIERIKGAVALPVRVRAYDCTRHVYGCAAVALNVSWPVLKRLLGHSSRGDITALYAKIDSKQLLLAANLIADDLHGRLHPAVALRSVG